MVIEKDLIGEEDINFGLGTVQRRSRDGSYIPITQVNAGQIPIIDVLDRFAGSTVETALMEVLVASGAGSSAADYLNNSGATRSLGAVVVVSTGADNAFTTTVTPGATNVLGVVAETILAGAVGSVVTAGFIGTVEVDAATSRGSFLITSTTAGKAHPVTSSQGGVFAIALSATAGAGQVSALIFGVLAQDYLPLSGGNLTGTLGLYKGTDVTSASSLNPFASGNKGNYFDVTATNAITSIATSGNIGTIIWLHFDDALTVTHHATNLILPGTANIVTSAGDEMAFVEYASGQWRMVAYIDASTTGTGNMVRATSPTIAAPTVTGVADFTGSVATDVVAEHTAANGVTVDGLNIKDGKLNTNDSVVTSNITNLAVTAAKLNAPFGAWVTSAVQDTAYLAATDLVVVVRTNTLSAGGYATLLSDSANPPTVVRALVPAGAGVGTTAYSMTAPVRKGDYWKVLNVTAGLAVWDISYVSVGA